MLWLHLIKGMRDRMNDPNFPVWLDREKQQPGYRRRMILGTILLTLLVLFLLYCWYRGWELPNI